MRDGGWVRNRAPVRIILDQKNSTSLLEYERFSRGDTPVKDHGRDCLLETIQGNVVLHQGKHIRLVGDVERSGDGAAQSNGKAVTRIIAVSGVPTKQAVRLHRLMLFCGWPLTQRGRLLLRVQR